MGDLDTPSTEEVFVLHFRFLVPGDHLSAHPCIATTGLGRLRLRSDTGRPRNQALYKA